MDRVDHVETDPIRVLESLVLGWFPAEEAESAGKESAAGEPDDLPEASAAFHRLARLRPAVHRFRNPVLKQPRWISGPLGRRLVFAVDGEGTRDWSIPWLPQEPGEADPRVWLTEDPLSADPETISEKEPLSRFLLQYTLYEAMNAAPCQAWTYCMPTAHFAPLRSMLHPVPLSPFLPTCTAEKFFVAPGLLTMISSDENEAVVVLAALHRATLKRRSNCQKLWISSCSYGLVVQVGEPFDGVQAGLQGGVRGPGGGEQQHLARRVFRGIEGVFIVVAGDRGGLDLDLPVGDANEVVDASVVAVALGEDQPEAVTDEPGQLAGGVGAGAVGVVVGHGAPDPMPQR
ncbi:hypothetical protein [Streptomyces prasinus]|uniref:hypothetical protein n=1 Tax=Streptomyces prasinus TaxID=67345 RepID=UPI0036C06AE9